MQMDIKESIAQREPFLFVDHIVDLTENSIITKKTLTGKEDFFTGHFPNNPIFPGVLMLEAMFQSSGPLVTKNPNDLQENIGVVTRVDRVKFKEIVRPPCELQIIVQLKEKLPGDVYSFTGKIQVEDKVVSSCNFMTKVLPVE